MRDRDRSGPGSKPRPLSIVVPCIGSLGLREKLLDLRKLDRWTELIVIAFNGEDHDFAPVAELPEELGIERCVVQRSEPFRKPDALRAALGRVQTSRVLYSDVDCLIREEPIAQDLGRAIESDHVISFAVLRRPGASDLRARGVLLRRHAMERFYRMLGLYYLAVRGGGYIAGDLGDCLARHPYSDDLLCPAEYAARKGVRIATSDALVFYETIPGQRTYASKIPRLVYGSFQAIRLSRFRRVKLSLTVQKLGKYFAVALSPGIVLGVLYAVGWPPWFAFLTLLLAPQIAGAWKGIWRGLADAPPRW